MSIARPYPIITSPCVNPVEVGKYRPPRIAIGPDTRALAVEIHRSMGAGWSTQDLMGGVVLEVAKGEESFTVPAVGFADYTAYFDVNGDDWTEAGLYRGKVVFGGCTIGDVEIVYAPSLYVHDACAIDSECAPSDWVEPPCEEPEPEEPGCEPCGGCCDIPAPCSVMPKQGYGV